MSTRRRDFLLGVPAGALGWGLLQGIGGAQAPAGETAPDVADFWIKKMGVPAHLLPGGEAVIRRNAGRDVTANGGGFGREPLFYYVDPQNGLLEAAKIDDKRLMPAGDTKVDVALQRLRLNPADQAAFAQYSSGGIYMDFQQHESNTSTLSSMASSLFSAFFPDGSFQNPFSNKKTTKQTTKETTKQKKSGQAFMSPFLGAKGSALAGAVTLQGPGQTQSISLPGGIGKSAFSCFAKDHKRSAFGLFVSAISMVTQSPLVSAVPLLSMPVIAGPSLQLLRALAGGLQGLQARGKDQHWILQSGPLDIAATLQGAKSLANGVRLVGGEYIAIPREHGKALTQMSGMKMMEGFLVPKETTQKDVYDAVTSVMPDLTYLSLSVKVSQVKLTNCLLPMPG
jgi:hypothetical protein